MKITTPIETAKPTLILLALACALALPAHAAETETEKQQQIRDMAQETLQLLYKADPKAKAAVKHASGYAVFSDLGLKILFAGSGKGKGIAVNNRTKKETFMKMFEVQAGLGMGAEKFRVVFFLTTKGRLTASSTPAGNSADNLQRRQKPGTRAARSLERCRSLTGSGCIN